MQAPSPHLDRTRGVTAVPPVLPGPCQPPHPIRVTADAKHLRTGAGVFRVRGVTYGTFTPRPDGKPFPAAAQIHADLAAMAQAGLNTLRVYTLPPPELLAAAEEHGLRVLVGLDFHDWRMEREVGRSARCRILAAGRRAVAEAMALCAHRPAVLAVAVGNEVPVDLVRLHGIHAVEDTLSALIADVHAADPAMLATYVNFPTTEFLEVEGQDLVSFNVFLEEPSKLQRYLRHLQVVAGDKPVVLTEVGLAGAQHGDIAQAESLAWQLRLVDEAGCAGATVFAWTDEWAVGGKPVDGWGFGVTRADRRPKPALDAVSRWARAAAPGALRPEWPRLSVVVCAHNEERTLERCLGSLAASTYPGLDVIVCDDGSTDRTLEIARRFPFRVLALPRGGLSRARNAGIAAAEGEIVAFLDADAACHPDWPYYLALSLEEDVVATGGPNPPFADAGFVERAVSRSPGRPMEVLLTDDRAEHVPGCNMAFRKAALLEIGGFDPGYTAAGDDVDVCWKLLDRGYRIGFAPAAQVWHRRRGTVAGYLRQQRGYGRAERMLSGPHRHRFNRLGQARWAGFVYGGVRLLPWLLRPIVYHGPMGTAPFQTVMLRRAEIAQSWVAALLPLTAPVAVAGAALGLLWPACLLLPAAMLAAVLGYAVNVAVDVRVPRDEPRPLALRLLVALLHVVQPFCRAWGRLTGTPALTAPADVPAWTGDRPHWLNRLRRDLQTRGCKIRVADHADPFDLEVSHGFLAALRLTTAVAWAWEPRHKATFRSRPPALVGLVLAGAVLPWLGAPAAAALGGLAAATALEMLILQRKVKRALRFTAQGAAPAGARPGRAHGWLRLLGYAKAQWLLLALIFVLTAVSSAVAALQPLPLMLLVDGAAHGIAPPGWVVEALAALALPATAPVLVALAAVATLLLAVCGTALRTALCWLPDLAGQRMVHALARDLFARLQRLSLLFHSRRPVGDSLSRLTGDTWAVYTASSSILVSPLLHLLTIAAVGTAAFEFDPVLALLSLALAPALAWSALWFGARLKQGARRDREAVAAVLGFVQQTLGAMPLVRAFATEDRNRRTFDRLTAGSIRAQQRRILVDRSFDGANGLITAIGAAIVLVVGGGRVVAGELTLGSLIVFLAYVRVLQGESRGLLSIWGRLRATEASVDRLNEVLDAPEVVHEPPHPRALPVPRRGHVRLEGVTFGYEPGRPVLHDLSLEVRPGETIALVGHTGAGKTSIVSLLNRTFDPWRGRVVIDGTDLRELRVADARSMVAIVRQEPFLLPLTVADNIGYGRPGAPREQIVAAARAAGAHEFIVALPDGYDTVVGELGATLSGGQRQRVAIARALLRDAPVLVLDEPTSALDAEGEAALMTALEQAAVGRTTFLIAHRLSTARHADRIVVIDDGKIVESGSHAELLAAGGVYQRFHRLQFAGATNGAPRVGEARP